MSALVLYFSLMVYPGMNYDGSIQTLLLAAVTLMLLNRIVKPLIKLFLLPINLITLGLFRWVANVATLFLLTRIVGGFQIVGFYFAGFESSGFVVPAIQISLLSSYILGSIVIGLFSTLFVWVLSD